MKAVIHAHSGRSYDSLTPPTRIVESALASGIDALFITDHDTLAGSLEAQSYSRARGYPIEVIPGAEYASHCGDIIGVGLLAEISSRDPKRIIGEIHAQGGLALLPHPYTNHCCLEEWSEACDVIETYNARSAPFANRRAEDLARQLRKPSYSGSDSHFVRHLTFCVNDFELPSSAWRNALLKGPTSTVRRPSPPWALHYSQVIKAAKRRDLALGRRALTNCLVSAVTRRAT